jgi:hypothetical protein
MRNAWFNHRAVITHYLRRDCLFDRPQPIDWATPQNRRTAGQARGGAGRVAMQEELNDPALVLAGSILCGRTDLKRNTTCHQLQACEVNVHRSLGRLGVPVKY